MQTIFKLLTPLCVTVCPSYVQTTVIYFASFLFGREASSTDGLMNGILQPGDHIAVEGEQCGIEYYHHGIFLGYERGVADFGGATKTDATVRVVDVMQFTTGKRKLIRINYPNGDCLSPENVVKNAEKLVDSPDMMGSYNVLKNNCEHFATKCKIGKAVSDQVIQKQRECIENPLDLIKYGAASSELSGSGSFGSS